MKTCIKDMSEQELRDWLKIRGFPAFRYAQIMDWLYRKLVTRFSEMTNLPEAMRRRLDDEFMPGAVSCGERLRASDKTEKFLMNLIDGHAIETVLIYAPERTTVCISTQLGCPVRCAFCASGRGGLIRNLTRSEMIDQVVLTCRELGHRVTNVVVMGIGEPLLNLDNLIPALLRINDEDGLNIGARNVTISTSGIVPGIHALAEAGKQWNLALSLHGVTDEQRAKLIPSEYRYPLADMLAACKLYRERTGRKITFEYALIAGFNDDDLSRKQLTKLALSFDAKVNIIPYNRTAAVRFSAPDDGRVCEFSQFLLDHGVQTTVRLEKGVQISAACGQLRRDRFGCA